MDETLKPASRPASPVLKLLLLAAVVLALFLLFRFLPIAGWIEAFKEWVRAQGILGFVAFGLVYAGVTLIPGGPAALLTLAGGAVFGFVAGTALVSVSSTAGATLAYFLARTALRERAMKMAASSPRFASLTRAIEKQGGRIVALVRLSPVFPFTIVNYLFGLTPVRPLKYILTSWIAMLPGTAAYVYFGSALGDAASSAGPFEKAIKLVLAAAAIVATVLIARFAAKAIRAAGIETEKVPEPAAPAPEAN